MDGSVVVSQLGARMHYAVPRIFADDRRLAHFYTDICASQGWPKFLNNLPISMLPAAIRRLAGRQPEGVPVDHMTTFPVFGLQSAIRRLSNRTGSQATANAIWAGETFGRLVAEHGFHGASGLYAFSGEALELMQQAKQHNLWTAVEQMIAPRNVVDQLICEEEVLNPGWQLPVANDVHAEAFAAREQAEWNIAEIVVCPSNFVARHVIDAGCAPEKITVVPYGVDLNFQPAPAPRIPGPLRVLTIGAVGLRKGTPYVYEVARKLADEAHFRLVGPIDILPGAREALAGAVELTGPIPRSEMRAQFRWADVFLLPSLCEGSATAVYEALAAGLPVICTENTGSVVRHEVDGFIVPIRDVAQTAEILKMLTADPELCETMAENARRRAAEFTISRYGERLLTALTGHARKLIS
ncbi:glycosyltransferase family 4 protein [Ochrobactrum sp. CM-21-5]|nr:glycosyltransferase family 4 protein [Ochrobactrum sp. CM-21-5]MBC2886434.1 glycosyltransferase family 4 protein [Ochrobactrum sp. CM-21-5]